MLRSLFFAFPGGFPGVALLLLRAVFGLAVLGEGRYYIGQPNPAPANWVLGCSAFAAGGLLIIGLLTPVIAAVATAAIVGAALSQLPASVPTLFDSRTAVLFGVTMLIAIMGLGPGAFSVDARLFGRREIIIPPPFTRSE
jgi:uncharacterized membrane protein YphA (DoxX/SURF4 family)